MFKHYFLTADVESTITDKVADYAAVLSDRKGNVIMTFAVLVAGIYDDPDYHTLFHNEQAGGIWKADNLNSRYAEYDNRIKNGSRVLASIGNINNWLMMIKAQYNPVLTAYNLPFDLDKCRKTGINLDVFDKRFCLWSAAITAIARSKAYRQYVLENHLFTNRTEFGNMSYRTNADTMARFILGDADIPPEPHTALEDILGFEKPILDFLLKRKTTKWLLNHTLPYNWREFQVKDWFKPV